MQRLHFKVGCTSQYGFRIQLTIYTDHGHYHVKQMDKPEKEKLTVTRYEQKKIIVLAKFLLPSSSNGRPRRRTHRSGG